MSSFGSTQPAVTSAVLRSISARCAGRGRGSERTRSQRLALCIARSHAAATLQLPTRARQRRHRRTACALARRSAAQAGRTVRESTAAVGGPFTADVSVSYERPSAVAGSGRGGTAPAGASMASGARRGVTQAPPATSPWARQIRRRSRCYDVARLSHASAERVAGARAAWRGWRPGAGAASAAAVQRCAHAPRCAGPARRRSRLRRRRGAHRGCVARLRGCATMRRRATAFLA